MEENKATMETGLTLYDMNKQLMAQEPKMDALLLNKKMLEMAKYVQEHRFTMLLCRERNDYTIFEHSAENCIEKTKQEISEVLFERGSLHSILDGQGGAFEVWFGTTEEDMVMYLFFDCDGFFVEA